MDDIGAAFEWSPDDPATPFAGPYFWIMDGVRVGTAVLAIGIIVLSILAARQVGPRQAARFAALAVFALTTGITEIEHLGDRPSPRMLLNLAAAALGLWGVFRWYRAETQPGSRPAA